MIRESGFVVAKYCVPGPDADICVQMSRGVAQPHRLGMRRAGGRMVGLGPQR